VPGTLLREGNKRVPLGERRGKRPLRRKKKKKTKNKFRWIRSPLFLVRVKIVEQGEKLLAAPTGVGAKGGKREAQKTRTRCLSSAGKARTSRASPIS